MFIALALNGCALLQRTEYHSFAFAMYRDNPNIEVLDFWYGKSREKTWIKMSDWRIEKGIPKQGESIGMLSRRQDFLYVKWRDKASKLELSDTVDLRHRLPDNISDHKIYFMIVDSKLYVYLIADRNPTDKDGPPVQLPIFPRQFNFRKVLLLYPG